METLLSTMDARAAGRLRFGGAWLSFALVAWVGSLPAMHQLDEMVTRWLQRTAPIPDLPASIFVRLGNAELLIPAIALAGALLVLRNGRSGAGAFWLAAGLAGASVLAVALKHVIVHPGPPPYLVRPGVGGGLYLYTPYSFPSGHTLRTTLLAGTGLRRAPWLAAALVVTMMLALVYTGAHWLSDVLGGLCLGWALMETAQLFRTPRPQNYPRG